MGHADRRRACARSWTGTAALDERPPRGREAASRGEELQPIGTATSVRVRDGETLVTDGPFAETKEVLGGYYLIEADTLDEAIDWAAQDPGRAAAARSRCGRSSTTRSAA